MKVSRKVAVIGAGLAGSDCAWILAEHYKCDVTLFEMKRRHPTPAQDAPHLFAELVCSNSLKSTSRLNPAGILKHEISALGSLVIQSATKHQVPAGETLAVDREAFSGSITAALRTHPHVMVREEIVSSLDELLNSNSFDAVIVATGPLTHDSLAENLRRFTESEALYFYDAIAPIIDGATIDRDIAFVANRETRTSRFNRSMKAKDDENESQESENGVPPTLDEGHYLNLPLSKEDYLSFVDAILKAPKVPFHDFEEPKFFNGCQPIEVIAETGPLTLAHGPMKGRGLTDPRTGRWPYAAVQLRKEKLGDAAYNMVGFQTRLTWGAQKEIFKTLPALAHAEFFRFGSMHRNTYLVSPAVLNQDLSLRANNNVYLAGQVMGVEGYLESASMGCFIGHLVGRKLSQIDFSLPPANTALGVLVRHVLQTEPKHYSPMNIHWGLFDELSASDVNEFWPEGQATLNVANPVATPPKKLDKTARRILLSVRAKHAFEHWMRLNSLGAGLGQAKAAKQP